MIFLWLGLVGLLPSALSASEIELEIAPVWWQYEESSGARTGFASTPLQSSAQGYGAELGVNFQHQLNDQWQLIASWKNLLPVYKATETWDLANGIQSNQLSIAQSELRLEVLRDLYGVDLGVWTSYQWHQQSRQDFIVNGAVVPGNGKAIHETVQTIWTGIILQAASDQEQLIFRLEGAVPIWVYTTNDLVVGAFTNVSGYRMGGSASVLLPWKDGMETHLTAAYQYRELGNELLQTSGQWLWPTNRWQTLSLEVSAQW